VGRWKGFRLRLDRGSQIHKLIVRDDVNLGGIEVLGWSDEGVPALHVLIAGLGTIEQLEIHGRERRFWWGGDR